MQHLPTRAAERNHAVTSTSLAGGGSEFSLIYLADKKLWFQLWSQMYTWKHLVAPRFTPSHRRKWWHCWPGCVHKLSTHLEVSLGAFLLFLSHIRSCVQLVGLSAAELRYTWRRRFVNPGKPAAPEIWRLKELVRSRPDCSTAGAALLLNWIRAVRIKPRLDCGPKSDF